MKLKYINAKNKLKGGAYHGQFAHTASDYAALAPNSHHIDLTKINKKMVEWVKRQTGIVNDIFVKTFFRSKNGVTLDDNTYELTQNDKEELYNWAIRTEFFRSFLKDNIQKVREYIRKFYPDYKKIINALTYLYAKE